MSEWQPARIICPHAKEYSINGIPVEIPDDLIKEESAKIHLVRQYECSPEEAAERRGKRGGCDATKFFEVLDDGYPVVCEHEILTD